MRWIPVAAGILLGVQPRAERGSSDLNGLPRLLIKTAANAGQQNPPDHSVRHHYMLVDVVELGRIPHSDFLVASPTHGPPTIRANGVQDCQEG